MRFRYLIDAMRSAWGGVQVVATVLSLVGGYTIVTLLPSVSGIAASAACLACYMAGYAVACYKNAKLARDSKDLELAEAKLEALTSENNELRAALSAESDERSRKLKMMRGFSRKKAQAIIRAYNADGMTKVGTYEMEVIGSIQAKQGIFTMKAWTLGAATRTGDMYGITDEWRAFLKDGANLAEMQRIARTASLPDD